MLQPIPQLLQRISDNKALSTLSLFGFLVVKVLFVAKGDVPTALGVLNNVGVLTVVVGGIVSALPLLAALLLALVTHRLCQYLGARENRAVAAAALALLGVTCLVLTPWPLTVGGLVVGVVTYAATLRKDRRVGRRLAVAVAVAVMLALSEPVLYAMWLPHEVLTVRGATPEVGYVLGDDGGWVSVLRSGSRDIARLPSGAVLARRRCTVVHSHHFLWTSQSVWQWFATGRVHWLQPTPDCPRRPG